MKDLQIIERDGDFSEMMPDFSVGVLVDQIRLIDFRNYKDVTIEFSSGLNVLSGANGQGKTNVLEALYLLGSSRLLRGQRDAEAIRDGTSQFLVEAVLKGTETKLGVSLERGGRKRSRLNGLDLPRASDILGRLPCVCISVADLSIVQGEPTDRRLFLDLELSALYPHYLKRLASYKRALDQRNALLRESRDSFVQEDSFVPWETQLADHGAGIRHMRERYLHLIAPKLSYYHACMGETEVAVVTYVPHDEGKDADTLLRLLSNARSQDVMRGGTSIGPHRDDLLIEIDQREARRFGSQGQQRTAAISMKLATWEAGREIRGESPLLLLDDMLSDLDANRRERLVDIVLKGVGQAVLTCTEPEAAGPRVLAQAKVFAVKAGALSPI